MNLIFVAVVSVILATGIFNTEPKDSNGNKKTEIIIKEPSETKPTEEKVKADFSQIGKALELFYINEKKYPSTQQGLQALIRAPETLRKPHLYPKDGYIKEIPTDPWGNPYLYLSPGQKTASYDLFTYGADGIEGGIEENLDLGNWAFE